MKNYTCNICGYNTSKKSSYLNHLQSQKHLLTYELYQHKIPNPNLNQNKEVKLLQDQNPVKFICEHCKGQYEYKKTLTKHQKKCRAKELFELKYTLSKELEKERLEKKAIKEQMKEQAEKLSQLQEDQNDYYDLLKQISKSNPNPNSNSNSNLTSNTVNLHYILNNFTEAFNYEDLMGPTLTVKEKKKLKQLKPLAGTVRIIEERCINNIDFTKRPLHCLDSARSKYVVRTENEWKIDHYAKHILKGATKHMYDIHAIDPTKCDLTLEQIANNQQMLINLESKGSQSKMIKHLGDQVHIKNIPYK